MSPAQAIALQTLRQNTMLEIQSVPQTEAGQWAALAKLANFVDAATKLLIDDAVDDS